MSDSKDPNRYQQQPSTSAYFPPPNYVAPPPSVQLTELQVLEAFHRLIQSSLLSGLHSGLFTSSQLSTQEPDAILAGPSLALLDGALRSDSNLTIPLDDPPSPGGTLPPNSSTTGLALSADTCPPTFVPLMKAWSALAPGIRALSPKEVMDLRRFLAGVPGEASREVRVLGSRLNGLAINISQRRTFQQRILKDLEYAERAGAGAAAAGGGVGQRREERPDAANRRISMDSVGYEPGEGVGEMDPTSEALMNAIRESLYAALADVLTTTPSLLRIARTDRARFYFGAVALALAHASRQCVIPATYSPATSTSPEVELTPALVKLAVGPPLRREDCPPHLRRLHGSLVKVQKALDRMDQLVMMGEEEIDAFERMEEQLVGTAEGEQGEGGGREASRRTIRLALKLDRMAREVTGMRAFKDRQEDVFKVLMALSGLQDESGGRGEGGSASTRR